MDSEKLWDFFKEKIFQYEHPIFFNQYNEINNKFDKENADKSRKKKILKLRFLMNEEDK